MHEVLLWFDEIEHGLSLRATRVGRCFSVDTNNAFTVSSVVREVYDTLAGCTVILLVDVLPDLSRQLV